MRRRFCLLLAGGLFLGTSGSGLAVKYFVQRGTMMPSADGKTLFYPRKEGAGLRIARVPVAGGVEELLTPPELQALEPRPAPRGGALAFIGRKDKDERLYVRTGEATPRFLALTEKGRYRNPVWHPDGKHLLVCQLFGRKWDFVYLDIEGKKSIRLLNYTGGQGAKAMANRIYVECGAAFDQKGDLLMVTVDGDLWTLKMRNLKTTNIMGTPILDELPVAMPRNKGFAFIARERGFQVELYTIQKDGTGLKRYSNTLTGEAPPAFDMEGKKMTYGAYIENKRVILETDLKTRETKRVGTGLFPQFGPIYAPDGETILFLEQRGTPETVIRRVRKNKIEDDLPLAGVKDLVKRGTVPKDVTFPPPPPETNPWVETPADDKVPDYLKPSEDLTRSIAIPGFR